LRALPALLLSLMLCACASLPKPEPMPTSQAIGDYDSSPLGRLLQSRLPA
jgi:starvation-inducible outer membrane lipoprotein